MTLQYQKYLTHCSFIIYSFIIYSLFSIFIYLLHTKYHFNCDISFDKRRLWFLHKKFLECKELQKEKLYLIRFRIFIFVIRGTKTDCFYPDFDLLNDKYLENNNGESFGEARLADFSPPGPATSGYLERKFPSRMRSISVRGHKMSGVLQGTFSFQYFPTDACLFNKPKITRVNNSFK